MQDAPTQPPKPTLEGYPCKADSHRLLCRFRHAPKLTSWMCKPTSWENVEFNLWDNLICSGPFTRARVVARCYCPPEHGPHKLPIQVCTNRKDGRFPDTSLRLVFMVGKSRAITETRNVFYMLQGCPPAESRICSGGLLAITISTGLSPWMAQPNNYVTHWERSCLGVDREEEECSLPKLCIAVNFQGCHGILWWPSQFSWPTATLDSTGFCETHTRSCMIQKWSNWLVRKLGPFRKPD